MLPGEPDPAVQLDRLPGRTPQRLQCLREREPAHPLPVRGRPGGVVGGRASGLHRHIHVREPVLHRLERADGPPELFPLSDVLDGPLQRPVGGPHGLGGEHGGGGVPECGEHGKHVRVGGAQQLGGHVPQLDAPLRAGRVERGLPGPYDPLGVPRDQEEQRPGPREPAGVCGDHEQPGAVAVQHLVDLAVQPPPVGAVPGLHAPRPAPAGPLTAVAAGQGEGGGEGGAGDGEGGGAGAGGEAGQQLGALRLGAEGEDQRGGEDGGGQQRGGGEGASRLLAGEGEFGDRAADPAVGLGDRQPRQAEPAGEGGPQGGVVPGRAVHGGPQSLGATAFVQQLAQGAADLVLLGGEARVHG